MSTRQIRLNTAEQIQTRLKQYNGRKINIVLCNRTVFFGELKSVGPGHIVFENMRRESVTLTLKEISEVYLDHKDAC